MSYLSNCEMCTGKGTGSYMPLESIASNYNSPGSGMSYNSSSSYLSSPALGNQNYSSLEYNVHNSEIRDAKNIGFENVQTGYRQQKYFEGYLAIPKMTRSYSGESPFTLQDIKTRFIGDVKEISDYIEKAFRKVVGEEFPDDIIIHVCRRERLKDFHQQFGGIWSDGINGFAVNRKTSGLKSEIFALQGQLSDVIATLGHEIGHCMSAPLDNPRDEEAKAFAFEFAWINAINEDNIANLRGCFNIMNPAKNNVHDKAFGFVSDLINNGFKAIDICFKLMKGEVSVGADL